MEVKSSETIRDKFPWSIAEVAWCYVHNGDYSVFLAQGLKKDNPEPKIYTLANLRGQEDRDKFKLLGMFKGREDGHFR